MDHTRFLETIHQVNTLVHTVHDERYRSVNHRWAFTHASVVKPESRCPFCNVVVRSNGIWFFRGRPRYGILVGMLPLEGPRVQLVKPGHPHTLGPHGDLCLGTFQTGMDLLAAPANLQDCPMGVYYLASWYRIYWDHPRCKEGREYLSSRGLRDMMVAREIELDGRNRRYFYDHDERRYREEHGL